MGANCPARHHRYGQIFRISTERKKQELVWQQYRPDRYAAVRDVVWLHLTNIRRCGRHTTDNQILKCVSRGHPPVFGP